MQIRRLSSTDTGFDEALGRLLAFEDAQDATVDAAAADILADMKKRGDEALLEYTRRFDHLNAAFAAELELPHDRLQKALDSLPADQRSALMEAAARVQAYHEKQLTQSWSYVEPDGTLLGQKITPLDRVGLYVPGGKASYPSSVLMNAIPAKVAGVSELIMVTPTPRGETSNLVLAAAAICNVDRVFTIGGAQAVGALAYGTHTVPQVDKIVGPGNAYVAAAKRRVFGVVGIDMLAGPSEILVICDGKTDPDWIAMDLFSQAEHDELAQAILLSPDPDFIDAVAASISRQLEAMPRKEVIRASLEGRGALIRVRDLDEACAIANRIAPEHLELSVEQPENWMNKIRHAGAIFLGRHTSEALGDYCAGPNHVLPTSRTARFSSPLGVYDFQKRSSIIQVSADASARLGRIASILAHGEGLQAHARSAEYRFQDRTVAVPDASDSSIG
ncbi:MULTISPECIES: histidinol dehydrogenase [unclassified Nitrosospira]|uniref:histidinol dehydrogenase n=1 Tax=unclassified Nitrosospira TaxID=2609267 RepID=UPI000D300927|nr:MULTISPECIES: histidinol dehydrogenase [unclassified Nitrosospira]WON75464.1 histidinol dehydrogenase [Nitrosospira sp. Is2]